MLASIERSLAGTGARFVAVDDVALTDAVGSRKVLNSVLLASALKAVSYTHLDVYKRQIFYHIP